MSSGLLPPKMALQQLIMPSVIDIDHVPRGAGELADCLLDRMWRLNNLYRIIDEHGRRVVFKLKPPQLQFLHDKHGLDVVLKARQLGFTTLIDMCQLDDCIFIPNLRCGIIAQTMIDAQSIFADKIMYPYNELCRQFPRLVPAAEKKDACQLKLANNSSIRVGISFRSATIHRLHPSEMGKICAKWPARALELKTGTIPAVHPQEGGEITVESTAEGPGGDFYDLVQAARISTDTAARTGRPLGVKEYRLHFFPWYQDRKNSINPEYVVISVKLIDYFDELKKLHGIDLSPGQMAWYESTRNGANGLGQKMKQEHPSTIDEPFERSVDGAVYAQELLDMRDEGRIGRYPWVKDCPVFTFWDLGVSKGNANCIIYAQFVREQIRVIDYYECENRGMTYHAAQVLKKPYVWHPNEPFCYMPHDVVNRSKEEAIPLLDTAESLHLRVAKVERPLNKDLDGIEAVRSIFPRIVINEFKIAPENEVAGQHDDTDRLIKGLGWYRYIRDEERDIWSKVPVHDWASNCADSLQSLALALKYNKIGGTYKGDNRFAGDYHTFGNHRDQGVQDVDLMSL